MRDGFHNLEAWILFQKYHKHKVIYFKNLINFINVLLMLKYINWAELVFYKCKIKKKNSIYI